MDHECTFFKTRSSTQIFKGNVLSKVDACNKQVNTPLTTTVLARGPVLLWMRQYRLGTHWGWVWPEIILADTSIPFNSNTLYLQIFWKKKTTKQHSLNKHRKQYICFKDAEVQIQFELILPEILSLKSL